MTRWGAGFTGLIPTHAGKTRRPGAVGQVEWAHPRSRGENISSTLSTSPPGGSSPLTRGKLDRAGPVGVGLGLIPAHAGKTRSDHGRRNRSRAHPRSRGENLMILALSARKPGSSPLTRGKRSARAGLRSSRRLIPAHAGKTPRSGCRCPPRRAHPRSRGENVFASGSAKNVPGSSPLTRGKLRPRAGGQDVCRLIPAHAGKTWWGRSFPACSRAHPRSRGENIRPIGLASIAAGSSPLTRGKRVSPTSPARLQRLIPAHAGKTVGHSASIS